AFRLPSTTLTATRRTRPMARRIIVCSIFTSHSCPVLSWPFSWHRGNGQLSHWLRSQGIEPSQRTRATSQVTTAARESTQASALIITIPAPPAKLFVDGDNLAHMDQVRIFDPVVCCQLGHSGAVLRGDTGKGVPGHNGVLGG
ncbi:aspartate carbamoyltransferase regulatory subunit, partial [Dysosmobacter welbionis]